MRKIAAPVIVFLISWFFQSCLKDKIEKTYWVYEPVYKTKSEVLSEIKSSTPSAIKNPGKIYFYGNYIFLNEVNKGIHIIDNSNPSSPVIKAFINVPGNVDIAVRGNTLYADLFTDMVVIDIANPLNATLKKVIPRVFPERVYANGTFVADSNKVIVDWVERKITERIDATPPVTNRWLRSDVMLLSSATVSGASSAASAPTVGIAGSMSRFTIINDYMYAVNRSTLNIFNISNTNDPLLASQMQAGWDIETIYPFKDRLFLGASAGMFIYNISNPTAPVREGTGMFAHARACDPVVADDNYAYITLRAGSFCAGTNNELDIVNVQDLSHPMLTKTYGMTNPFGLAKDGNLLFICDGRDGLKIYNAADVNNLRLIKKINNLETYDVIAWNKKLMLVAKEGLYQFDYSNSSNIFQLSKITVGK
ncbi:MAG: LVIVD repeat-containing protein [Sphingobacteriales bacterium]